LQDREEARVGGRVAFARNWSVFGSAIIDLTSANDDPLSVSDGFDPIRHRLGVAYDDDCLSIALTWRRDYIDTGDARRGNSFSFRVAFRNLGF
jgi:LPS-assembly protein